MIIVYAVLDEYHQSFIPGREAYLRDVMIDTVGGSTGIIFTKLILWGNNKEK
ncbi:VanZ family protein [Cetobacterium sp.]|uniref:VanZ family protein n=1 Tax=Cetobacterium sp. TaxID=2071632 RepID=UPI003FA57F11